MEPDFASSLLTSIESISAYNNKQFMSYDQGCRQGRRLVINIGGGKNLGHKYWGSKNFLKIYFKKKIFKSSLQFSKKILTTFFLVIEHFFSKKCTLFIENVQIYFLFFVFFFLSLCFCFLSCLFFLN